MAVGDITIGSAFTGPVTLRPFAASEPGLGGRLLGLVKPYIIADVPILGEQEIAPGGETDNTSWAPAIVVGVLFVGVLVGVGYAWGRA